MTLDEFMAALEKTARTWRLTERHMIRNLNEVCPVCAVANSKVGELRWHVVATLANEDARLGIKPELVHRIARAADDNRGESTLRARLLKACGLQ